MHFSFTHRICAFMLAASLCAGYAQADEYPRQPIRMVVPFAAGGPTDTVARSLSEAMHAALGQIIVVENKGGAGGMIGTNQVAAAKPNGYEILLMNVGFTTAPSLYKKTGYDPEESFEPIGLVVSVPMTIIGRSDLPVNDVGELIDYVKTHEDAMTIAHAGNGSAAHLCSIMFTQAIGVDLLTIPYKGTAPAINDLLGKQVDLLCDQTTNTTQHINTGIVKAYAMTSKQRIPTLPDLPTMQESGYSDFDVGIWHGLWAPKGTPEPALKKLRTALQAALASPRFRQRMAALGATVLAAEATPEALAQKVHQQTAQWTGLFKKVGIEPQ
ncbi:tripartite tricarboxylate transporter substrate-binding protein [Advenella mimigardefordensis]|uniref:Putative Bug-like extracytoplasmic solute binding receptor, TTT family n=1 Tax=Advenella mimigardefordensis (strain DSM 17166 / LMG 22922 / DPN7) TaxID=1247726 RepID=W0PM72_ADVMD|nr:putative Bug-like extracytoplasmic solute binding receptor, TTT family [Advenella mimigardefordensis DPN7]